MKTLPMPVLVGALIVALLLGAFVYKMPVSQEPVACSADAMICPDGSAVGRMGPNCEFSACPTGGTGILPYNSGVSGKVMLGPTCPVVQNPPEHACDDRPFATSIDIVLTNNSSYVFARTSSAADGSFRVALPPGSYMLKAGDSKAMLPYCSTQDVTVGAEGYTSVTISCDTGIR